MGSVKVLSIDYKQLSNALKDAAGRIKRTDSTVQSVYLFGSFARGDYTPLSDIDILITVSHTDLPYLERRDRFIDYFKVPLDVNITVYTLDELKIMIAEENNFIKNILAEAVKLT